MPVMKMIFNRKYRVSKMGPFASNIGFLMMECEEAPMERVMTFLQEKPVQLPKCDHLACDWQTFKDIYQVFDYLPIYGNLTCIYYFQSDISCQFDDICTEDGTPLRRTLLKSNSCQILVNLILLVLSVFASYLAWIEQNNAKNHLSWEAINSKFTHILEQKVLKQNMWNHG